MQVGCAWGAAGLISYSLGGSLSILDPANPASAIQTHVGHNRAISSICWATASKLVSASYAATDETSNVGCMRLWDAETAIAAPFSGSGHDSRVLKVAMLGDGTIASIGGDNMMMLTTLDGHGAKT